MTGTVKDKKSEGFEQVFVHVGGLGWFQFLLFLCVSLQALVSWHHLSYVFLGAVPPHWCSVPELQATGWTPEQIRNISVPKAQRTGSEYAWETCSYYNLDYASILLQSNQSYEAAYSLAQDLRNVTSSCSKWDWDLSVYHATTVTQFNLVCGSRIWVGMIQGTYMGGVLLGSLVMGSLSDQFFGRRLSTLISTVITIVAGFATAFSTSYSAFVLFRFILAAGVAGSYQNSYVLLLEYSNAKSRAAFGLVGQLSFAVGYMLVAVLGYFFRDWADLQLSFSTISLVVLSYYWVLPESARWLAYRGEDEKAYSLLKTVARLNGKPEPKRDDILRIFESCRNTKEGCVKDYPGENECAKEDNTSGRLKGLVRLSYATLMNYCKLLQTKELRKRTLLIWALFVIVDLVYYGVVFDSATLTHDPFLLVFLAGLMEIPAYTLVVPCLTTLGRRPTVVGTFFLTAVCSFIVAYTPLEYQVFRVAVSMCGKLFITSCFAVLYLLGAELYPTSTRTTGLASAVIMGRLGSILAPFIVDLTKTVYRDLPNIIFGMVSVAAAIVGMLLPETRDAPMYNDIGDLERDAALRREAQKCALRRLDSLGRNEDKVSCEGTTTTDRCTTDLHSSSSPTNPPI